MKITGLFFLIVLALFGGCSETDKEFVANPQLTLSHSIISIDAESSETLVNITNSGNTKMSWNLQGDFSELIVEPYQGTLNPGESVPVKISANLNQFNFGVHSFTIRVLSDQILPSSIFVDVVKYEEEKLLLDENIVDAEFDKNNDLLIAIASETNNLLVIDPVNKKMDKIELGFTPKCLSISQDGDYVVIGHKGVMTYVNLQTRSIESVTGLTFDVFDIVLAPNNWVYLFPEEGQWTQIYCMNLVTGVQKYHQGANIYHKTIAKLHPTGNSIYGANTSLIPSDFEKYDVSEGIAKYLYDSPYHGDYHIGKDIWISEDGKYLFSKEGEIFSSSDFKDKDMIYAGKLEGIKSVSGLDYSLASNRIYALPINNYQSPSNEVRFFDATSFELLGTTSLPSHLGFEYNGRPQILESIGQFGFFDSKGKAFHVLLEVKAHSSLGKAQWGLVSLNVD